MPLTPGSRLGVYEVTAQIGEGGMGQVYRATDTKLKRQVAIKILPPALAADPDRLARFQREAEVLASLNHPNIAIIHGLEDADGVTALVMELVEGEDLSKRIARGALPLDEALPIATQIAEALDAAHAQGIIHRDLKPANIKVRPDGVVKVLDFGLAKAMDPVGRGVSPAGPEGAAYVPLSQTPTMTSPALMTGAGVILGTAAYMSPEQARGRTVDKRADIWAFGAVLFEMLTGQRPFDGEDVAEILSRVLQREPDWTLLPANVPPRIRELLRLCLQKSIRNRRSDAADVRIDLEQALAEPAVVTPAAPAARRARVAWMAFAAALVAAVVFAIPGVRHLIEALPAEIRVDVTTPPAADPLSFAMSPDGTRLVFSASNEGRSQLFVRPLDSIAAQPLAGTEGASYPFWSPDGASLGFFADNKLKRIDLAGGAPQVLANAPLGRGGTWNAEGVIVFTPSGAGPLFTLPATGGDPVALTRLEPGQRAGHRFPQFLPDGRHFIYLVGQGAPGSGIHAGSLDDVSSKRLTTADAAAVVSPSGFLFFLRQTTLFAQSFDFTAQELSGSPFPVAEQVAFDPATGSPGFSAASGTVAYRTGSGGSRQLTWLDRFGKTVGLVGTPDTAGLYNVELSPDGRRVAAQRSAGGNTDVWVVDTARGVPTRFTFDAAGDGWHVWSPDGSRIVFDSNRDGGIYNLYEKSASGAGTDELLLSTDQTKGANDWSADGRLLLFRSLAQTTGWDLWVLPMSGERKPLPFLTTPFEEREGQFSPDGRWVAYQSNESGRPEIYVQPFPGPGGKFQVSTNGGAQVRWNRNGRELFYVSLDSRMMAAAVTLSPDGQSLETGTPVALFPVRIAGGPLPGPYKQQYAVSSDGQRFLVSLEAIEGATSPITLILNWKPPAK